MENTLRKTQQTNTCKQMTVNTRKKMSEGTLHHVVRTHTHSVHSTHTENKTKVRFTEHGCAQNAQTQKHTGN